MFQTLTEAVMKALYSFNTMSSMLNKGDFKKNEAAT